MRSNRDIEQAVNDYGDTVWRICALHFHWHTDAQDAFQNTFLKYAQADNTVFTSEEHRKAWLVRVATNACNDIHRSHTRHPETELNENMTASLSSSDPATQPSSLAREAIDALQSLPDPPRTPLYLSIVEGYTAPEIAEITEAPVNTVYSWIRRGKKLLKEALS